MDSITLPISGGIIIVSLAAYFGKLAVSAGLKKVKVWDDHVRMCESVKAVGHAQLEGKVDTLCDRQDRMEKTMDGINGKIDRLLEK